MTLMIDPPSGWRYGFPKPVHEDYYLLKDDFSMYVSISKYANNALPKDIIQNYIFKNMRIKKKNFPKKLYYSV